MTVRERQWAKASPNQQRIAAVGLASFLCRFYARYDDGDRFRALQEQVRWLWAAVSTDGGAGVPARPPIGVNDDDRFIPDADADPSAEAAIGQAASLAVFTTTTVVRTSGNTDASDLWDYFDECYEHASETADDEAAYSAGLRALRGLPVERVMAGLEALNNMPRKSQHAKRVKAGFRAAETAVRDYLVAGDPAGAAVARMRERLDRIDVSTLLYRWRAS